MRQAASWLGSPLRRERLRAQRLLLGMLLTEPEQAQAVTAPASGPLLPGCGEGTAARESEGAPGTLRIFGELPVEQMLAWLLFRSILPASGTVRAWAGLGSPGWPCLHCT